MKKPLPLMSTESRWEALRWRIALKLLFWGGLVAPDGWARDWLRKSQMHWASSCRERWENERRKRWDKEKADRGGQDEKPRNVYAVQVGGDKLQPPEGCEVEAVYTTQVVTPNEDGTMEYGPITSIDNPNVRMPADHAAELIRQLTSGSAQIQFADGVKESMAAHGVSMDELKKAFIQSAKKSLS